jgi:hypothetical protein
MKIQEDYNYKAIFFTMGWQKNITGASNQKLSESVQQIIFLWLDRGCVSADI